MKRMKRLVIFLLMTMQLALAGAQELNCNVKINHSQVQGTNTSVFETLQTVLNEFMNHRAWTELQFAKEEKIVCSMSITVKQYDPSTNAFTCEMLFQVSRPVFNSTYSTTVFSKRDKSFNFTYVENEPLEFMDNNVDNSLTAMLAYYAYLFIGLDLDTFSPMGGTDILNKAMAVANNAQNLGDAGWKAFSDDDNRHAMINDYLETSMEPFRQMMYKYHREGLDEMENNVDRGRTAVTEALNLLQEAHSNKTLSRLPQIFTDYKRDEIVNIYKGHGTEKEKSAVYEIVSNLNASQNAEWKKIQK